MFCLRNLHLHLQRFVEINKFSIQFQFCILKIRRSVKCRLKSCSVYIVVAVSYYNTVCNYLLRGIITKQETLLNQHNLLHLIILCHQRFIPILILKGVKVLKYKKGKHLPFSRIVLLIKMHQDFKIKTTLQCIFIGIMIVFML